MAQIFCICPLLLIFRVFNSCSDSDVDVTGISQFSVSDSIYHVANDSVILKSDADKYSQDSDESMSEYDSPIADAVEENER